MRVLIISAIVWLSSIAAFSQCPTFTSRALENYRTTKSRLLNDKQGTTKYVQTEWFQIVPTVRAYMFLAYCRYSDTPKGDPSGINKGSITFDLGKVGDVHSGKVYYEDETWEVIEPFEVDRTDPQHVEASFTLRGGELDLRYEVNYYGTPTPEQLSENWLSGNINLAKGPVRIVLLTDLGAKEIIISDTIQLSFFCVLNRFTSPFTNDYIEE